MFEWDDVHHYGTMGLQAGDVELSGLAAAELVIASGLDPDELAPERWAGQVQVIEVEPWQLSSLAHHWPDPPPVDGPPPLYTLLRDALADRYASSEVPLAPARAAADLAVARPAGGVVLADPGPAGLWVARAYPTSEPGSVVVPGAFVRGFAAAAALVADLSGRPSVAVTTDPLDETSQAVLELARSLGRSVVLEVWGGDGELTRAEDHVEVLAEALGRPGVHRLDVPVALRRHPAAGGRGGGGGGVGTSAAGAGSLRVGLRHPHPLRKWFVAVLAVWMATAVLQWGRLAQDAIPYQVAGELVADGRADSVYATSSGDLYDLAPDFASRWCELAPPGTDCAQVAVAFVSTPASLPFAWLVWAPGARAGVLLARLVAAGALALGMGVLWNRLAGRRRDAPQLLLVTAVLLTPMAAVPITLGQTSPLLFLLACVGVVRTDGRPVRRWATAALWASTVALKAFPAVVGLVLLRQRRLRLVVETAAVLIGLGVVALALGPLSLWADFVRLSGRLADWSVSNPYSGSVDNLLPPPLGPPRRRSGRGRRRPGGSGRGRARPVVVGGPRRARRHPVGLRRAGDPAGRAAGVVALPVAGRGRPGDRPGARGRCRAGGWWRSRCWPRPPCR